LPQDVQLLWRAGESDLAVVHQLGESFVERDGGGELLGLLGQLADDGEHRPFLRVAHSCVRGIARTAQRLRECLRGDLALRQRLHRTAHDLGKDHPGVASRTHERGPHDVRLTALERRDDGSRGLGHVRPRVSVRDRVDVEIVDPLPARLESGQRRPRES
jgi:hypothetical protein